MDHCSDPAGTESCNVQIRWETNSSTMQVHIHGQWMLPSLMHSFVGQSSIRELCPPALVLERERTEGRKREKFYIYLDVIHTHTFSHRPFYAQTLLHTNTFTQTLTLHLTLYTLHSTPYTLHCTRLTPQSTLYTLHLRHSPPVFNDFPSFSFVFFQPFSSRSSTFLRFPPP